MLPKRDEEDDVLNLGSETSLIAGTPAPQPSTLEGIASTPQGDISNISFEDAERKGISLQDLMDTMNKQKVETQFEPGDIASIQGSGLTSGGATLGTAQPIEQESDEQTEVIQALLSNHRQGNMEEKYGLSADKFATMGTALKMVLNQDPEARMEMLKDLFGENRVRFKFEGGENLVSIDGPTGNTVDLVLNKEGFSTQDVADLIPEVAISLAGDKGASKALSLVNKFGNPGFWQKFRGGMAQTGAYFATGAAGQTAKDVLSTGEVDEQGVMTSGLIEAAGVPIEGFANLSAKGLSKIAGAVRDLFPKNSYSQGLQSVFGEGGKDVAELTRRNPELMGEIFDMIGDGATIGQVSRATGTNIKPAFFAASKHAVLNYAMKKFGGQSAELIEQANKYNEGLAVQTAGFIEKMHTALGEGKDVRNVHDVMTEMDNKWKRQLSRRQNAFTKVLKDHSHLEIPLEDIHGTLKNKLLKGVVKRGQAAADNQFYKAVDGLWDMLKLRRHADQGQPDIVKSSLDRKKEINKLIAGKNRTINSLQPKISSVSQLSKGTFTASAKKKNLENIAKMKKATAERNKLQLELDTIEDNIREDFIVQPVGLQDIKNTVEDKIKSGEISEAAGKRIAEGLGDILRGLGPEVKMNRVEYRDFITDFTTFKKTPVGKMSDTRHEESAREIMKKVVESGSPAETFEYLTNMAKIKVNGQNAGKKAVNFMVQDFLKSKGMFNLSGDQAATRIMNFFDPSNTEVKGVIDYMRSRPDMRKFIDHMTDPEVGAARVALGPNKKPITLGGETKGLQDMISDYGTEGSLYFNPQLHTQLLNLENIIKGMKKKKQKMAERGWANILTSDSSQAINARRIIEKEGLLRAKSKAKREKLSRLLIYSGVRAAKVETKLQDQYEVQ